MQAHEPKPAQAASDRCESTGPHRSNPPLVSTFAMAPEALPHSAGSLLHLQMLGGNTAISALVAQSDRPVQPNGDQYDTKLNGHRPAASSRQAHRGPAAQAGDSLAALSMRVGDDGNVASLLDRLSGARLTLQLSAASDLIDMNTSWGNLDEDHLGGLLLDRAVSGDCTLVQAVLDELGSTDRDDVSFAFMEAATAEQLTALAGSESGRRLLDRMLDELTSGSVADDEQKQADRIIQVKGQRIDQAQAQDQMLTGKIFPFRLPGLTVFSDAPIFAERREGGQILVEQPVRVLATDMFRGETSTLPREVFTGGLLLHENEIVGVKLYDLGGQVVYRPALFLIQIANQNDTATLTKIAEITGIGLTLGSGSLIGLGVEAGMAARVLLWADRAAFVLGTLTTVINEHRGEILERFGDTGREFLRYVDIVQSATAIYGFARMAIGMAQLVGGLRRSYQDWRAAARASESELSGGEQQVVRQISRDTDEVLQNADDVSDAARNRRSQNREETSNPPEPQVPTVAARRSEVSTLANSGGEMLAGDAIRRYNVGSGFSGAYDPESGRFVALASGNATLASGQPVKTVPQFSGHADAEAALAASDPSKTVGFVLIWEGNETVSIRWNSGTINGRNFGNRAAPMAVRSAIKEAVAAATRCMVIE